MWLRLRYDFTLILITEMMDLDSLEIYFEHCVACSVVFYDTSTFLFLL